MPNRCETRRSFLKTAGLGIPALALGMPSFFNGCGKTGDRPNIVLFFIDDMGYGDLGCTGAEGYETSVLDRMAEEGIRFTQFYVTQAVCSASRASLLTGCYSERVSIQGALGPYANHGIHPDEETIADLLKKRGYATAVFGKWHLGHHREFLPLQHGFDEYFGLPYSNDMWPMSYDGKSMREGRKAGYPELPLIEGNEKVGEIRNLDDQNRLTKMYTRKAVDFIERNKSRPFFLYIPHSMVHTPLGVSDQFRGKSEQGMFGDVMMEIDASVGRILETLRRNGLEEKTLVIFTSDNGPWLNFGRHAGSALPLREGKGTMFEGGVRVPCIMRWPERISAGTVCDRMAASIDLLPTLASIAGAPLPKKPIDGVNILPLMLGDKEANPRDHFYYYYGGGLRAVRQGRWKLFFPHTTRTYKGMKPGENGLPGPYARMEVGHELYDLEADVGEMRDVSGAHPDVVARLEALAEQAREELGDRLIGMNGKGVRPPGRRSMDRQKRIRHRAAGKTMKLKYAPSPRYPSITDNPLLDGHLGSLDHGDGFWQGFHGNDLEAVIDLGKPMPIREMSCSFLENQPAWIFLPTEVEFGVSEDGTGYRIIGRFKEDADPQGRTSIQTYRSSKGSFRGRYIRVVARNMGLCPSWHAGADQKAWIFADEIVVE